MISETNSSTIILWIIFSLPPFSDVIVIPFVVWSVVVVSVKDVLIVVLGVDRVGPSSRKKRRKENICYLNLYLRSTDNFEKRFVK